MALTCGKFRVECQERATRDISVLWEVAVIYAKTENMITLTVKPSRARTLIASDTANFRPKLLGLGATNMKGDRKARDAKETLI
jgi:hypothetical protein